MKVSAIIPVRYGATRFPGKPLAEMLGKPMIQWVWESIKDTYGLDQTIIATDDERIFNACRAFEADVRMTSEKHKSGTDRIAEIAENLDSDLIINMQGDEPLANTYIIESIISLMGRENEPIMGSLARKLREGELENPNVVKVWIDSSGNAVYFSRKPDREGPGEPFAHIGIYIYKRDFLLKFSKMEQSQGEIEHKLEQLRAMDSGVKISIAVVDYQGFGVDTPEDLAKAEKVLSDKNK